MAELVSGKIVKVKHWTNYLFSLVIHAPVSPFIAGQFTKLEYLMNNQRIRRAYSYVNAPKNEDLEFYFVAIENGRLSQKLQTLKKGDEILITKEARGFFIIDSIPECENLWMIATGTAIGPYLSILEQGDGLERFKNIILVHAVRFEKDLSYLPQMKMLKERYHSKLHIQIITSRDKILGALTGHIQTLISNGSLEKSVNLTISSDNSHIMLCGNPKMVSDTQNLLEKKFHMYKKLQSNFGHITSEQYW